MTPTQPPLPGLQSAHHNQYLFSDHYLNNLLPTDPRWAAGLAEGAALLAELRQLYAGERKRLPRYKEAQLEQWWLRPILDRLGHIYEPQAAIPGLEHDIKSPDYVLFPDVAARQAAVAAQKTADYAAHALGVAEVKAWDVPLGKKAAGGGADFSGQNPSFQIDYYLRATGLRWGILSNGRRWRLVHSETSQRLSIYYEVDLVELLERDDPAALLYFTLFFRQAAFLPDAQGRTFLDDALAASNAYAVAVESDLRRQAYEALPLLMQGFLDYAPNRLGPDGLPAIYDNTLYLLYRLLFIFYGESRGLLPIGNTAYYTQYSLTGLKQRFAATDISALSPRTNKNWGDITTLFHIVNGDDPELNRELGVPRYNGGLFDPELHPFLEQKSVGDRTLVQALNRLSHRHNAEGRDEFIDYRTLGVRHLGSIYEGLLEYRPKWDGKTVVLETDRGERRATGSYYTPQYIVEYMVASTLGPLVEAARNRTAPSADASPKQAAAAGHALAAEILKMRVVDPAMGSGHFIVEATEYLALALATDPYLQSQSPEEDLAHWRRQVVERCIYGVDKNPLAVELAKLSLWLATAAADRPLSFLDHHLKCGDSLVGARVEDLGEAPAALLDKRALRERQRQRDAGVRQANLFESRYEAGLPAMIRTVLEITGRESISYEIVHEKERANRYVRELIAPFAAVAGLWTSASFGNRYTAADYNQALDLLDHPRYLLALPAVQTAVATGHAMRFFHWELEFPEVYYNAQGVRRDGDDGFDAVVGNPPYVRQEQVSAIKTFFSNQYPEAYHGVADLFVYFFAQGLRQLRHGGRMAYIASNSWLRANYAGALRAHLRTNATVETIVDLGDNRVFADAPDVCPAIQIVRRDPPPADYTAQAATFVRGERLEPFDVQVTTKLAPVNIHSQPDSGWQLGADEVRSVFAKLMGTGHTLRDEVNDRIFYGVKTGLNEAFIIDQATRDRLVWTEPASSAILKPLFRGEDLRPWYQENEGRWLIFARQGIDIEEHPAIKAHLQQFRERLEPRQKEVSTATGLGRKSGSYSWFEIQDRVEYYAEFYRAKILWPDIAKFPRFSWDDSGALVNDKGYILIPDDTSVLAVLQSRPIWLCISQICTPLGERVGAARYQQKIQFVSRLPIPDMLSGQRIVLADLASRVTAHARERYDLQRQVRRRILADLGAAGAGLNQKLTTWWELDFPAFRGEVHKVFKHDISLKERDDWEAWLADARAAHSAATAEIVRLETELNTRVYALFDLTPAEIAIIEASTKYRYGEV